MPEEKKEETRIIYETDFIQITSDSVSIDDTKIYVRNIAGMQLEKKHPYYKIAIIISIIGILISVGCFIFPTSTAMNQFGGFIIIIISIIVFILGLIITENTLTIYSTSSLLSISKTLSLENLMKLKDAIDIAVKEFKIKKEPCSKNIKFK